jgi:hypothetical protein
LCLETNTCPGSVVFDVFYNFKIDRSKTESGRNMERRKMKRLEDAEKELRETIGTR